MTAGEERQRAALIALAATAVLVVLLKMMTGLAFAPLVAIAALVFGFALALSLRVQRSGSSRIR